MIPPRRRSLLGRRGVLAAGVASPAVALADPVRLADFGIQEGKDIGPALQRAIDATGGAPVVIGPGRYRIETPVVVKAGARGRADDLSVSRQPGPTILGAGTKRTLIDCAVPGGAPFTIDQARPYAFTVDGRIEGMTLNGVAGVAGQDGLRVSGAWNYTFADLELLGFSGHGLHAPWREDLRWTLDGVQIEAGSRLARRTTGAGFGTASGVTGGSRVHGAGIEPGTKIVRMVDSVTIELSTPATATTTAALEFVGNSDAFQSIVSAQGCRFAHNRGWGIRGGAGIGLILSWAGCEAQLNRSGGVYCAGNAWRLSGGAIYDNGIDGGCGLMVEKAWGTPQLLEVDGIEFDSNHRTQVWLKDVRSARFTQSRFISHYYPGEKANRAPVGVTIGNPDGEGAAVSVRFDQCHFRSPLVPAADYSCVRFGRRGTYDVVDLVEPFWISRRLEHRWFEAPPHPDARVAMRAGGQTVLATTPGRAASVLEKSSDQVVRPGQWTEVVFDRLAYTSSGATGQRVAQIDLVAGVAVAERGTLAAMAREGEPVTDLDDGGAIETGARIGIDGDRVVLSRPARAGGIKPLVVGGVATTYGGLVDIEASFTVVGAGAGRTCRVAVTFDGAHRREWSEPLAGTGRQTIHVRATVPVDSGIRVGLRIRVDGDAPVGIVGGVAAGGFSVVAVA